jgi:gluconate 2-dehydrogenase gamma chain
MDDRIVSRRALLKTVPGTVGLAWLAAQWPTVVEAATHAHAHAQADPGAARAPSTLRALSPREAAIADAVAAQIIPTDDTPGAREAGVVWFIDWCLANRALGVNDDLRAGLVRLDDTARARFPDADGFVSLTPARQQELLHGIATTPFFEGMRFLTVCGFLASPKYGGNRDEVGWKVIGFEDPHAYAPPFGHYDAEYEGFVPYPPKTTQ